MTTIDNHVWREKRQLGPASVSLGQTLRTHVLIACLEGARRLLRSAVRAWTVGRAIKALRQMDDRLLHDIGIHRCEIEYRVREHVRDHW